MKNIDIAQDLAKDITTIAVNHEINGEPRQFTAEIAPLISNALFHREKEIRQEERLKAIIRLSKTSFTEDVVLELIEALQFKLL